jgi:hypothetical protein
VAGEMDDARVEPMYGDLGGRSPWARRARLAAPTDELCPAPSDCALRTPPLARAFEAVHRIARERLAGDDARRGILPAPTLDTSGLDLILSQ